MLSCHRTIKCSGTISMRLEPFFERNSQRSQATHAMISTVVFFNRLPWFSWPLGTLHNRLPGHSYCLGPSIAPASVCLTLAALCFKLCRSFCLSVWLSLLKTSCAGRSPSFGEICPQCEGLYGGGAAGRERCHG